MTGLRLRIASPRNHDAEREFLERQRIDALARELDVSPDRVRRALETLKARGLISRAALS